MFRNQEPSKFGNDDRAIPLRDYNRTRLREPTFNKQEPPQPKKKKKNRNNYIAPKKVDVNKNKMFTPSKFETQTNKNIEREKQTTTQNRNQTTTTPNKPSEYKETGIKKVLKDKEKNKTTTTTKKQPLPQSENPSRKNPYNYINPTKVDVNKDKMFTPSNIETKTNVNPSGERTPNYPNTNQTTDTPPKQTEYKETEVKEVIEAPQNNPMSYDKETPFGNKQGVVKGLVDQAITDSKTSSSSSKNKGEGELGSSFNIKTILDRRNIDELIKQTLFLSGEIYYPERIVDTKIYYYNSEYDVPFLIYIEKRILYLIYRGSVSLQNFYTDLQTSNVGYSNNLVDYDIVKNRLGNYYANIEFHSGFIRSTLASYDFIENYLEKNINAYNYIVVGGHSLAGSVGQIFSYIYNNNQLNIFDRKPIKYTISFGSPRALFNKEDYIFKYNTTVPSFIRCWLTGDIVPYFPLKEKISIDNTLNTNMGSGFTHIGTSFNLDENLKNNNMNIFLYELIKGNTKELINLLREYTLEETSKGLKLLVNNKYLSLLTYCLYSSLEKIEIKKKITNNDLGVLSLNIQEKMKEQDELKEKCDIVKPFGISDLLEANPLFDDLESIRNFSLASLSFFTVSGNKIGIKNHSIEMYEIALDKLINKQITERRSIFDIINNTDYKLTEDKILDNVKPMDNEILGLYEGNFNNFEIISF